MKIYIKLIIAMCTCLYLISVWLLATMNVTKRGKIILKSFSYILFIENNITVILWYHIEIKTALLEFYIKTCQILPHRSLPVSCSWTDLYGLTRTYPPLPINQIIRLTRLPFVIGKAACLCCPLCNIATPGVIAISPVPLLFCLTSYKTISPSSEWWT